MLHRLNNLIKFYLSAKTLFGVHSPFVYEFCEKVLDDKRHYYAFSDLKYLREKLEANRSEVQVNDFGAGSMVLKTKTKTVGKIAKTSGTNHFFAELLFKMVVHFQPKTIVELGTSLGIGTLYFSAASEDAQIYTVEGCPNVAGWANHHFKVAKSPNIKIVVGEFDKQLPKLFSHLEQIDLLFIDGNHRYQPTIDYFEMALDKVNENSIIIFDDIYWSEGMTRAWEEVKKHPAVTHSIDLFQFGIVFFRKDFKNKEHLKLVPLKWKPWRVF